MKILINPEWKSLTKDLTTKQKAELFDCLLSYPDGDSKLGVWEFMRAQIDRDAEKYQARCKNLSENRQKRWPDKQTDNRNLTDEEQTDNSPPSKTVQQMSVSAGNSKSISIESENNIEKEKSIENKKSVDKFLKNFARDHSIDAPMRYEITEDFNFDKVAERDVVFRDVFYSGKYTDTVLAKATRSLHSKRYGQRLTLQQLIDWVEQEGKF